MKKGSRFIHEPQAHSTALREFSKRPGEIEGALAEDPGQASGTVLDGTIQRFEFSFELAWKLAKHILNYQGIEAGNPRDVIKESFAQNFFKDGDGWIAMLEDRNRTVHVYDEEQALRIYNKIKDQHYPRLEEFSKGMDDIVRKLS